MLGAITEDTLDIETDIASWPKVDVTWTMGERALLLELYYACEDLPYYERQIKFKQLSDKLRDAAERLGYPVNEKYRNAAGIRHRGSIFIGPQIRVGEVAT